MTNRDWVSSPSTAFLWWGLPIVIGIGLSFLHLPFRLGAGLCSVLFLWMAVGCLLNARRCHRLHCYISGPVLLLGAVFAAVIAAGAATVSQRTFGNAVGATLVLALLSFVPEMVWRRYV